MLGHGKASENLKYSLIITNKYLSRDELGRGPMKSMLIRLKGFDALMKLLSSRLCKDGLSAAQMRHEEQTLWTLPVEKGKFIVRTKR